MCVDVGFIDHETYTNNSHTCVFEIHSSVQEQDIQTVYVSC